MANACMHQRGGLALFCFCRVNLPNHAVAGSAGVCHVAAALLRSCPEAALDDWPATWRHLDRLATCHIDGSRLPLIPQHEFRSQSQSPQRPAVQRHFSWPIWPIALGWRDADAADARSAGVSRPAAA